MGIVLPREAHAAEHLDGPLGRFHVAVEGQGGGQLDGQTALVGLLARGGTTFGVENRSGVPRGGHTLFDRAQHVGEAVLDSLELTDGPAELFAGAGVLGGGVEAPA